MLTSRNVIAGVSRELSQLGFGVMVVDLYGCGDSSGDFVDARWEIWRNDLQVATRWLQDQGGDRLTLWGLRLGALLALDVATYSRDTYQRIVLWQPVLSGELMLNQFLRMNLSAEDGNESVSGRIATRKERRNLVAGETIEVAGYSLAADLVRAIDQVTLPPVTSLASAVQWIEFTPSQQSLAVASLDVIMDWKKKGLPVSAGTVASPPFWLFPYSVNVGNLWEQVKGTFGSAIRV
jgi:exosortase A-associated hydrolase 2